MQTPGKPHIQLANRGDHGTERAAAQTLFTDPQHIGVTMRADDEQAPQRHSKQFRRGRVKILRGIDVHDPASGWRGLDRGVQYQRVYRYPGTTSDELVDRSADKPTTKDGVERWKTAGATLG